MKLDYYETEEQRWEVKIKQREKETVRLEKGDRNGDGDYFCIDSKKQETDEKGTGMREQPISREPGQKHVQKSDNP